MFTFQQKAKYTLAMSLVIFLTACGDSKNSANKDTNDSLRLTLSSSDKTNQTTLHPPKLTLLGDQNITLTLGDKFQDPGAVAEDQEDGNLTDQITVTSDLNLSKIGEYTIQYSVIDSDKQKAHAERIVNIQKVHNPKDQIPIDSNIELGLEPGVLYYADPRPQEHGLNRVLRIDYNTMTYRAIPVPGNNPHSIDRAGESDKFYVRTQNSYSFDVVNFKDDSVKTVDLGDHKPRAIGAYNKKYNIQLLSGKDMPIVDVIDVTNDKVIATLGERRHYNKSEITSNAGAGSATGHALWFDEDHLGIIDRVNRVVRVYRVRKDKDGSLHFDLTSELSAGTAFHALERDRFPKTKEDTQIFYAMGEGDLTQNINPYVLELRFDPATGHLTRTGRTVWCSESNQKIDNITPTTHHAGVSPDGKYLVVPVTDGKVYIIDRASMKTLKVLPAHLGAAHIEFSAAKHLAIVTNHFSNILTIIDMDTLAVKKEIQIGFNHEFDPNDKHLFQPHFSYVSPDGKYYYTFATQDGNFLKIDLDSFEIVDKIHVGGAPEQAHS